MILAACVPDGGDKTRTVTATDTGACVSDAAPTVDSTPPTGDDTGPTTTHDSGDSTATTHDPADPDHDYDGDGWTENEGDCNDNSEHVHPHHAESCLTTGDDDCDGSENENCSRWYVERVEGSILFDTFGAMFSTQRWTYSNDAGHRLCDLFESAPNAYSAPECPQCEWTFTAIQSSAAWSANCAANLGLFEGSPPA